MALFLVIAACGGGEPPATSDGGPEDADAGATPPEVAPAELPTAPSFRVDGACPAGWIPVDLGEALICAPFGGDDPRRCDAHALHVPSEAACRPAGRACEDPPAPDGVVVHVRAGASGGDGSESAPFGELDVALAAAASGSALVLAPGRYETDGLVLDRPLRLYGACAAETSVVARAGDAPGAIVVTSAAVVLDGISVTGPEHGIIVREGGEASLRGVVVLDVPGTGLWVAGRVEAEELVTRMLEPGIAGELDVGVLVHTTGHLSLRRAELRGHDVAAIGVFGGELELEDVVIGAQSHPAGALRGHGVEVAGGGRARARRLFVSATNDAGILVEHEGSSLELEDTLVGDVKGASIGVTVLPGATCSMRRVVVGAITNLGVDVAGGGCARRISSSRTPTTHGTSSASSRAGRARTSSSRAPSSIKACGWGFSSIWARAAGSRTRASSASKAVRRRCEPRTMPSGSSPTRPSSSSRGSGSRAATGTA